MPSGSGPTPTVEIEELDQAELKAMTARELEQYAKKRVKEKIMSRGDLTEDEKAELVAKQLKEVAAKQVREKGTQMVEAWQDKVRLTEEGWKERYYREKFLVRGPSELKEFCKNIR